MPADGDRVRICLWLSNKGLACQQYNDIYCDVIIADLISGGLKFSFVGLKVYSH